MKLIGYYCGAKEKHRFKARVKLLAKFDLYYNHFYILQAHTTHISMPCSVILHLFLIFVLFWF